MGQVVRGLYTLSKKHKVEIKSEEVVCIQQKFEDIWDIVDVSFGTRCRKECI